MKDHFEEKLKSYSALAAGLIAVGGTAEAQIIYTDIDPDITISDTNYLLDLNNDNIPDFNLVHLGYFYYSTSFLNIAGIQAMGNNEILGDTIQTTYNSNVNINFYPRPLNANDLIDTNQKVWYNTNYAILYEKGVNSSSSYEYGLWKNVSDKFIGLRFKIGNDWHYGWARLSVAKDAKSITIKDYAYESHPDKKILAGQTFSSLTFPTNPKIKVYHTANQLFINIFDEFKQAQGSIVNLMGEELIHFSLENGQNMVNIEDLPKGIYIIRIGIDQSLISQKIVK